MSVKTKMVDCWQKVKTWVGNHKTEVILGSALAVAGAIGVVISNAKSKDLEKEGQEILATLESTVESDDSDEDFKDTDRYVVDKDIIDLLPAGTYDVFDTYENERVDYVIEDKGSMET